MSEELKPVKCGCGGEGQILHPSFTNCIVVMCGKCGIKTPYMNTEAEAVKLWNTAMGADQFRDTTKKMEPKRTKGYWMATCDGLHCSVCNYKCETTALPNVCPSCGARLEWDE